MGSIGLLRGLKQLSVFSLLLICLFLLIRGLAELTNIKHDIHILFGELIPISNLLRVSGVSPTISLDLGSLISAELLSRTQGTLPNNLN